MRITALAGGVGGARFVRGLRHHLDQQVPAQAAPELSDSPSSPGGISPGSPGGTSPGPDTEITVIANTGDDITLFGLRVCPDVDTLLYTLGEGINDDQGWGRAGESHRLQGELAAYGVEPQWFSLGDLDLATHIARSQWLGQGHSLSEVTARLAGRWGLPDRRISLLPMSDTPVETHVVIDDGDEQRAVHFQEWWVRMQAAVPARRFVAAGMDRAAAAPGVLEAIREADIVVLPPSNPVVSIGIILGVPGVRDALRGTNAPVVGVSPLISGRPVRGHADACLEAIGVPSTASGVAGLYADFLDGWVVDPADADATAGRASVRAHSEPLLMTDVAAAGRIAATVLDVAEQVRHR